MDSHILLKMGLTGFSTQGKADEMIIVPGKVLGGGNLDHKVTISAYKFSASAREKLEKLGCTIIPINDINKGSIEGKRVRILG